ncbi:ABC transporter permease [Paenibacillus sp. MBLB4367]|uniref:ABC transporter permease n=1 Tax=Paenibacillus sp. MBLB4367 TaxID=3384767 RepID=UPI00390831A1
MIARVLAADLLKIRRKMIWGLAFLGPFGVVALQAVNFGLRYDYLTKQYAADLWKGLLGNIQFLAVPSLLLGITIVTSMIAGVEHHMNAWKQLLALPVSRKTVFAGKFLLSLLLLLVSCSLLAGGTMLLGWALGFGTDFPYGELAKTSFLPLIASMPVLALQLWLSVTMRNQAIPLTVGILGTVLTLFAPALPDWLLWKWPLLQGENTDDFVRLGAGIGLALLAAGLADFTRRDVK